MDSTTTAVPFTTTLSPDEMDFEDASNITCYTSASLEPVGSLTAQRLILALYLITSLVSILGNGLVLAVQLLGAERLRSMRIYLSNLAVADIALSLISMPFTYSNIVLGHWPHAHWLCPTAQFVQLLTSFVTSATLSIIGFERYIVTLYPLSSGASWFKSHHLMLLLPTWLLGSLYAAIPLTNTAVSEFTFDEQSYYQCSYRHSLTPLKLALFIGINFLITFLFPLFVITFAYLKIIHKLSDSDHFTTFHSNTNQTSCILVNKQEMSLSMQSSLIVEKRSRTIQMLLIVVVAYCVCWLPLKLYQLLLNLRILSYCSSLQFHLLLYSYIACHWLAMANSMINPLIYSFMSRRFRNDFRKVGSLCWAFLCK